MHNANVFFLEFLFFNNAVCPYDKWCWYSSFAHTASVAAAHTERIEPFTGSGWMNPMARFAGWLVSSANKQMLFICPTNCCGHVFYVYYPELGSRHHYPGHTAPYLSHKTINYESSLSLRRKHFSRALFWPYRHSICKLSLSPSILTPSQSFGA